MPPSACIKCNNMIKGNMKHAWPSVWACTHPLRDPASCYTGMDEGILGYQNEDCPDQDPGHCHEFTYNMKDSKELDALQDKHGDYSNELLTRGIAIALEGYVK